MANSKLKPGNRKPITSHPLFPAVVALWFGALFGLGSLAIRPTLIESVVLKTGIDMIVPAAAPPLGITARILIALVMASLGAALGATLAMRLARPKPVVRARKRNAANTGAARAAEAAPWNQRNVAEDGLVRRPISAHEELGDAMDSPGLLIGRRRPLAVEHEDKPFQPPEFAPLPGGEPQAFDFAATHLAPPSNVGVEFDERAPLDLGAFPPLAQVEPAAELTQPQPRLDWSVQPIGSAQPLQPEPITPGIPVVAAEVSAEYGMEAAIPAAPAPTQPAPESTPIVNTTAIPAPAPVSIPAEIGMTDLAKRLQESMARRRAAMGGTMAVPAFADAAPVQPEPASSNPVSLEQPAVAEPAFVTPPPLNLFPAALAEFPPVIPEVPAAPIAMPDALRPLSFEIPEEEEHHDLASLMPRHLTMPLDRPVEPRIEADEDVGTELTSPDENAFASLLSIETSQPQFVRIDEPEEPAMEVEPVVIFPGQMVAAQQRPARPFDCPASAPSGTAATAAVMPAIEPAEAELALRSALANLQRISGAA